MAEKRTRRRFTAEFKAQAVKRLLEGGRGLSEVATELGLSPGQLSTWRTEHLVAGSARMLSRLNIRHSHSGNPDDRRLR
jgi:transposase-like protein